MGTLAGAEMYSFGGCPAVVLTPGKQDAKVVVEVFEVSAELMLGHLDAVEGFYDRDSVEVTLDDGRKVQAYVYNVHRCEVKGCPQVQSGDWVKYCEVSNLEERFGERSVEIKPVSQQEHEQRTIMALIRAHLRGEITLVDETGKPLEIELQDDSGNSVDGDLQDVLPLEDDEQELPKSIGDLTDGEFEELYGH